MNLAIIEDGVLLTPPADDILEGCTVRRAMELVTECGVLSHLGVTDARYEDVEIDRAKAADEVMVSLSLLSVWAIGMTSCFFVYSSSAASSGVSRSSRGTGRTWG